MPGWYVHLESARETGLRLQAGAVPPGFPISVQEAKDLGEVCHRWRNYLALGSLGPDLFYLLPDFSNQKGCVIRHVVQWVIDTWDVIDKEFVAKWEKWIGPISTNSSQLASQLTGGLSNQLGQIMDELSASITNAFESLLPLFGDWFGLLTSGVPQAFADSGFYWSDVFHYRRTYQFPFALFKEARGALDAATTDQERFDAEARVAYAIGWMTHCGTDVTGHPFTNAKSGGPYRDHWQRHHLVENHMDAQNYVALHPGPLYGEYGESALHFWLAFRSRSDAPYTGRMDGPAYDYYTGLPAYDLADTPTGAANRAAFFDLDSGELPDHLIDAVLQAMLDVHPNGPKILTQDPPFSATDGNGDPDGRPNKAALDEMWSIVYAYLKMTSKDGLSPRKPMPPSVFTDHSFPTPPGGGGSGIDDDPSRGADVDDDDFNLLDLLLAIFAWAIYIAEVIVWLVTVLPGLIIDPLTFPAREVLYYAVQVPAWNLYLLSRRALVMTGFLMPRSDEVAVELTTLGTTKGFSIATALDDPMGIGSISTQIDEPSGRLDATHAFGIDPAYPRNIVRDRVADVHRPDVLSALGLTKPLRYAGDGTDEIKPSEWVKPWAYPVRNQAGDPVPQEGAMVHVGPYVAGSDSTVLLSGLVGDDGARARLEKAATPRDTFDTLNDLLPQDRHLGGPVDYSTYLVGRMAADRGLAEITVPDFNLDSDRGYAWHCWDWDRHSLGRNPASPGTRGAWECIPDLNATPQSDFHYGQPCTPPQQFAAGHDNPAELVNPNDPTSDPVDSQWYDPHHDLKVHYLGRHPADPATFGPDPCKDDPPKDHELVFGTDWKERLDHR